MKQDFNRNRDNLRNSLLNQQQQSRIRNGDDAAETSVGMEDPSPRPVGKLKIEAIYLDGETKVLVDENNLVVRQAEAIMAFMSIGLRQLGYIELGDPSPPNTPELEDTTLQQTTGERKATTNSTSGKTAIHEALWGPGDANGLNFTEAGLFTNPLGTGVMFARKAFEPIAKVASFSLKFTWAIAYSVQAHNDGCTGVSLLGSSTVVADFVYESPTGGEVDIIVPIDFNPGFKQLDVFLRGQRLVYNRQYYELVLGASAIGIRLLGFTLNAGDVVYFVNRKLA